MPLRGTQVRQFEFSYTTMIGVFNVVGRLWVKALGGTFDANSTHCPSRKLQMQSTVKNPYRGTKCKYIVQERLSHYLPL